MRNREFQRTAFYPEHKRKILLVHLFYQQFRGTPSYTNPYGKTKRHPMKKNTAFARNLIFLLVAGFISYQLGRQIWLNWREVYPRLASFDPFWALAAILLVAGHYLIGALLWENILAKLLAPLPLGKGVRIWAFSQMGRYIPGKVWTVLGRLHLCERENIPKLTTSISISLDMLLAVIAALLLFLLGLPFWPSPLPLANFNYLLLLVPPVLLLLHPRIFEHTLNFLLRLLKQEPVRINLGFGILCQLMLLALCNWLIVGAALFCVIRTIYVVDFKILFLGGGIFACAWILGMLAIFAPSGIGVREGVLAYLLGFHIPAYIASVAAILARLLFLLAEVVFFVLVIMLTGGKAKKETSG